MANANNQAKQLEGLRRIAEDAHRFGSIRRHMPASAVAALRSAPIPFREFGARRPLSREEEIEQAVRLNLIPYGL